MNILVHVSYCIRTRVSLGYTSRVEWLHVFSMWMLNFSCFPNCSPIYTYSSNLEDPVDPFHFEHCVLSNFVIFANQMGIKIYLIIVLICTSLITNDVEHLFLFFNDLKCFLCCELLVMSLLFCFFSIGLFVLFLICSFFYVFLTQIFCWLCVLLRSFLSL